MLYKFHKFLCSTAKVSPKLVEVKIKYDGNIYPYQFPLHTKLAPNLQKMKVDLEFECGFGCSCGTCPVSIDTT
jgi:ferredoxin